jgi:pimeloyl-ACP methyl ester carboxylesterase
VPSTIINGVNLYYECHGEGEPLMLIAGLASDSQGWLTVAEPLSRRFLLSLCLVIPWGGCGAGLCDPLPRKSFQIDPGGHLGDQLQAQ